MKKTLAVVMALALSLMPTSVVADEVGGSVTVEGEDFKVTGYEVNNGQPVSPPATFNISVNVTHPNVAEVGEPNPQGVTLYQNVSNTRVANWLAEKALLRTDSTEDGMAFRAFAPFGHSGGITTMRSFESGYNTTTDIGFRINDTTEPRDGADNITVIPSNAEVRLLRQPELQFPPANFYNPMNFGNISQINGTEWTQNEIVLEKGADYYSDSDSLWSNGDFIAVRNETENRYAVLVIADVDGLNLAHVYGAASTSENFSATKDGLKTVVTGFRDGLRAWSESTTDHQTNLYRKEINSTLVNYKAEFDVATHLAPNTRVNEQFFEFYTSDSSGNYAGGSFDYTVSEVKAFAALPSQFDFGSVSGGALASSGLNQFANGGNVPFSLNVSASDFTGNGYTIDNSNINLTYNRFDCGGETEFALDSSKDFGVFEAYTDSYCENTEGYEGEVDTYQGLSSEVDVPKLGNVNDIPLSNTYSFTAE